MSRLQVLGLLSTDQLTRLHRHARTLATLAATEHSLLQTPASVVAGSALTAAYRSLQLPGTDQLVERLALCLSCSHHRIELTALSLEALVEDSWPGLERSGTISPPSSTMSCCVVVEETGARTPTDCVIVAV